mgnify:CR=1 FL=1
MKRALVILVAFHAFLVMGGEPDAKKPGPITSTASIRLIERGAILVEDFDARELDQTRWRVWQNSPDRTTVRHEDGRLNILVEGGARFRLLELTEGRAFVTGRVEPVDDQHDPADPSVIGVDEELAQGTTGVVADKGHVLEVELLEELDDHPGDATR